MSEKVELPVIADRAERCETCRFYEECEPRMYDDSDGSGWCHRYPPQCSILPDGVYDQAFYPRMTAVDWCGEWQQSSPPAG